VLDRDKVMQGHNNGAWYKERDRTLRAMEKVHFVLCTSNREQQMLPKQPEKRVFPRQNNFTCLRKSSHMPAVIVKNHIFVFRINLQQGIDKTKNVGSWPSLG
jgi:hypothetical protein